MTPVGSMVVAIAIGLAIGASFGWIAARRRRDEVERTHLANSPAGSTSTPTPATATSANLSTANSATANSASANSSTVDSTQRLVEAVVKNHTVGVVVVDDAGRTIVRNPAVERHAGTHVGALLDAVILRHLNAARDGRAGGETIEIYGPPPTVLVVDAFPLGNDGEHGGAVAFVADVSDQRRIAQVRTDFVANISHELKTPIGAISVLAEALEDETDPAVVSRLVGRLESEAHRAANTIDDLMELSQLELDNERVCDDLPVDSIVRAALDRVAEMAHQKSIGVTTLDAVSPARSGGSLVVRGDRRQLTSAVGNLIENAVKYSDPGGQVTVRLVEPAALTPSTTPVDHDKAMVGISVIDRGIGIPARDVQRIFERFYRVDRARSRDTGGTGLGLSIVRHVANRHGGRVEVDSEEGQGSTFTLWLPIVDDRDIAASPAAEEIA